MNGECPANTFSGLHVFEPMRLYGKVRSRCRHCHLTQQQAEDMGLVEPVIEAPNPGVRANDPDTSWEAALGRLGGKAADRRAALEWLFVRPDGLTDFELGEVMGRQQTSAGKRRGELRDLGLVVDTGQRRPAPSGSSAIVWAITAQGMAAREALRRSDEVRA